MVFRSTTREREILACLGNGTLFLPFLDYHKPNGDCNSEYNDFLGSVQAVFDQSVEHHDLNDHVKTSRGYYGGAIGFMDFDGNFNHAIMIRTFLSKNHELHWQAGAGLVSKSNADNELQEVYNKLGALTHAIELAETI